MPNMTVPDCQFLAVFGLSLEILSDYLNTEEPEELRICLILIFFFTSQLRCRVVHAKSVSFK